MSSTFVKIPEIPQNWARDRKIEILMPIATQVSNRCTIHKNTTTLDKEDLYQIASLAIIQAVDKFDPSKEVSLVHYARKMANWSILEAIRTHSHATRKMIKEGHVITWLNFSTPVGDTGNKTIGETIGEQIASNDIDIMEQILVSETSEEIMQCINDLPEKQREMLIYYIENNCTQREVASHIGLSESRVIQLLKKSIKTIKQNLIPECAQVA